MENMFYGEDLKQHEVHEGQILSLNKLWERRMQSVQDDAATSEAMLKAEIARLQAAVKVEKLRGVEERKKLVDGICDHVSRHSFDGNTSVPFLLHNLEKMTNGLVLPAQRLGASTPSAVSVTPSRNNKRLRGSEQTKAAGFEHGKAVKRTALAFDSTVVEVPKPERIRPES